METRTSKTLSRIIDREFDSQSQFGAACGFERATVNRDITGRSLMIPDDRFGTYLNAVTEPARVELVRARVLDLIPEELHEELIFRTGTSVREDLPRFSPNPALTAEQRSALEWLANELTRDSQLIEPVMTICERLGWTRPDKKSQY